MIYVKDIQTTKRKLGSENMDSTVVDFVSLLV